MNQAEEFYHVARMREEAQWARDNMRPCSVCGTLSTGSFTRVSKIHVKSVCPKCMENENAIVDATVKGQAMVFNAVNHYLTI